MMQLSAPHGKSLYSLARWIGVVSAAVAFLVEAPSAAAAEEFIIKFDEVGYDNVPADVKEPESKVFRSVEVSATIDSRFSMRMVRPEETIIVRGALKSGKDGHYSVEFRHTVQRPIEFTDRKAETTYQSSVNLRLNEHASVGGITTKVKSTTQSTKTEETQSKRGLAITVIRPADVW
jgi:hypothetical protein